MKLPTIAESIEEVTVLRFMKEKGDFVELDEEFLEVESHKGNMTIRSTEQGAITKLLVDIDADIKIGTDLVELDTSATKPEVDDVKKEPVKQEELKEEPIQAETQQTQKTQKSTPAPISQPKQTTGSYERVTTREKMSRLRKTVGIRLKES